MPNNHISFNDQVEIDRNLKEQGIDPPSQKKISATTYLDLMRHGRVNYKPDGFNFDMNMFENLCDCWTPKEEFMDILNCDYSDLDKFCMTCYNMNFADTYRTMINVTNITARKAFKGLAFNGNPSALKVVAEGLMRIGVDNQNNQPNITIINDIKKDGI